MPAFTREPSKMRTPGKRKGWVEEWLGWTDQCPTAVVQLTSRQLGAEHWAQRLSAVSSLLKQAGPKQAQPQKAQAAPTLAQPPLQHLQQHLRTPGGISGVCDGSCCPPRPCPLTMACGGLRQANRERHWVQVSAPRELERACAVAGAAGVLGALQSGELYIMHAGGTAGIQLLGSFEECGGGGEGGTLPV